MQRWNRYESTIGVKNVGTLRQTWSYPLWGGASAGPTVAGGVLYFGGVLKGIAGTCVIADALDGAGTLWSTNPSGEYILWGSPAVANGLVFALYGNGVLYALNAKTGTVKWQYSTGTGAINSPALANGAVYFGTDNGVYAVSQKTGALLWSYQTGSLIESSPAVVNGVVYIGAEDNNLYAINATTGSLIWSFKTGGFVNSSPAVSNGVVYVGSLDNNIYAINATTGVLIWTYTTSGGVGSALAVANGLVYAFSEFDGNLYAINTSNGSLKWSTFIGISGYGSTNESPAVANGVVYIVKFEDFAYALNASTGAILWSYTTEWLYSSPTIVNGVLYIGGSSLWAFELP
jgi:outer membrane protein assembly factor BamB